MSASPVPGQVVRVGASVGVVVRPAEGDPDEHVAVWYGESDEHGPLVRTVPCEHCVVEGPPRRYH